MARASALHARG